MSQQQPENNFNYEQPPSLNPYQNISDDTNINPYTAPKSTIEQSAMSNSFYVVSEKKLTILTLATLGMYTLYWFWKHWSIIKHAEGSSVWPIPRAIFSVFFTHKLFEKIERGAAFKDSTLQGLQTLATIFVITQVANNISTRLLDNAWMLMISSVVVLAVYVFILRSVQQQANIACGDPEGDSNSKLTALNYVFIVLGILIWVLAGIGLFIPL